MVFQYLIWGHASSGRDAAPSRRIYYGVFDHARQNIPRFALKRGAMDNNTLYVSDLDGTLMRSDETLSAYTVRTVNALVAQGLAFTYATARSVESARTITRDLRLSLPVITRNGAVLADNATGEHLEKAIFTADEISLLKKLLPELPRCGFVSCFVGSEMIKTYLPGEHTAGLDKHIEKSVHGPRLQPVSSFDELFCGQPGYVTLIDDQEKMAPLYERVRQYPDWECLFQKDTYWDEFWLEICPRNCTKAKSILKMKERYGYKKLVVFGDSVNDLSMFHIADEAYAVAGALDSLKAAATGVIGSNDEDAVARFLESQT